MLHSVMNGLQTFVRFFSIIALSSAWANMWDRVLFYTTHATVKLHKPQKATTIFTTIFFTTDLRRQT